MGFSLESCLHIFFSRYSTYFTKLPLKFWERKWHLERCKNQGKYLMYFYTGHRKVWSNVLSYNENLLCRRKLTRSHSLWKINHNLLSQHCWASLSQPDLKRRNRCKWCSFRHRQHGVDRAETLEQGGTETGPMVSVLPFKFFIIILLILPLFLL